MTAAKHSPLFEAVWRSIVQERLFHDRGRFEPMSEERWVAMRDWYMQHKDDPNALSAAHSIPAFGFMATQAALDACQAEELRLMVEKLARQLKAVEPRYSRDEAIIAEAEALLAKLDGRSSGLGYCPICGAPGRTREKRPFGNDHCDAGHSYPSSDALPTKPEGRS